MIFRTGLPYTEALDSQAARRLLPTDLRTGDLARMEPALLRRAQFSAQVTDLDHLDELAGTYREILAGSLDRATARLRIKDYLARKGYAPDPDQAGGLQDLSSDRRINLQLDTNVEMMRGLGGEIQGMEPAVRDAFPARELVRVADSEEPRDWRKIWNDARAATTAEGATDADTGVMAAIVGHPIWRAISDFGNDYAPFKWGSNMGLRDVSRREAMALDIIGRDTQVFPNQAALRPDANVRTTTAVRDPRLRAALESARDPEGRPIGRFDGEGVYRLIPLDDQEGAS